MEKYASEKVRNYIHDDVASSILSKLPLKSLKRFGCVCKTWSVLFENPNFMIQFHTNFLSINHSYYDDSSLLLLQIVHNPEHTQIFFFLHSLSGERYENKVKLEFPNPFHDEYPGFYVLDYGNITGILCLHNSKTIVLWNPFTEEFKVIPPSPFEFVGPDQAVVKSVLGFGYDHISDDYKIISFVSFVPLTDDDIPSNVELEDDYGSQISYDEFWEVYSLRCNSWRKVDLGLPTCCWNGHMGADHLLYMDGICHWLSYSEEANNEDYLVSFDLTNEVCITTFMPLGIDPNETSNFVKRELVLLSGSIASISWYSTTFHISILGELGLKESWVKLFIVGPLPNIKCPIGAGNNGDIFFVNKDGEPICLDLCTQMIEELDGVKRENFSKIIIYKESLISIGGINH